MRDLENKRTAFEAWYGPDQTSYPPEVVNNQWSQDKLKAWEAWQAAQQACLSSPEVQELYVSLKALLEQDDHNEDEIWVRNKARAALAAMEN